MYGICERRRENVRGTEKMKQAGSHGGAGLAVVSVLRDWLAGARVDVGLSNPGKVSSNRRRTIRTNTQRTPGKRKSKNPPATADPTKVEKSPIHLETTDP
jgi:hypothetical protein